MKVEGGPKKPRAARNPERHGQYSVPIPLGYDSFVALSRLRGFPFYKL
jgi:hypothetical protein